MNEYEGVKRTDKPDRKPDFMVPRIGNKYEFHYWEKENVAGFYSNYGWNYYERLSVSLGKIVTPREYIQLIFNDPNHEHHSFVSSWIIETTLLE